MTGPTPIWRRGPIRAATRPDRAEKASITTVSGSSAIPDSRGE